MLLKPRPDWKVDSLNLLLSEAEISAINQIPIALPNTADSLMWHFDSKGEYSVKSGYCIASDKVRMNQISRPSTSLHVPSQLWKRIWALKIPPKLKHFWWRVCNNSLATKANLHRRRCAPRKMCPMCQKFSESVEHLLFGCDWVRAVWFGSNLKFPNIGGPNRSILLWSCELLETFQSVQSWDYFVSLIIWIGWFIWKDRNNFVFNHYPVEPSSTLHQARVAKEEFDTTSASDEVSVQQMGEGSLASYQEWQAPCTGSFKINCDVAILKGSQLALTAILLRDDRGKLIDGFTKKWKVSSALLGEALACRCTCQLALACNLNQVEIEGDNKIVIKLCVSESVPPWECGAIFSDIRRLAADGHFLFRWISRSANKASHWVAQASLHGSLPQSWVANPPQALQSLLSMEACSVFNHSRSNIQKRFNPLCHAICVI